MSFLTLGASVTFTATDSVTGQPVQGALCEVFAGLGFSGEGAYAYTNASGVCFVDLGYLIRSWRVTKTGYTAQQGNDPISTVNVSLVSTTPVYPVNITAQMGTGTGTTTATLNGVAVNTGGVIYAPMNGSLVITAHPASGSTFQKWRVNDVDQGSANPQTFIITGYADIEAWFTVNPGQVNVSVSPTGTGSVTLNPSGGSYPYGTVVTAVAAGALGYQLDHWVLDGNSYGPGYLQFTIGRPIHTLQAVFVAGGGNIYTLTVSVSPIGGGSVNPSGTSNQTAGSNVTLAATPASGYTFAGWGGDLTGTANPTTINMNGNKSVVANFTGGGGTYKTQQVSFFANHLLSIPVSWMGNNVEVTKNYKVDEAKTIIHSATLKISAVNGGLSDAVVLSTVFNLSEVASLVWNMAELGVTKTSDVDVTPFLINGDNTLKFDFTRASGLQFITKDVWITAILLIEYEGDDPTVTDKTPVDWEKYLPWIIGGGAVLVGVALLTRGGGGGGGQGVTLNIREPARRVYQSVRKRVKKR